MAHARAQRTDILLLELARQVPLDERGLPSTAVPHQNQLLEGK